MRALKIASLGMAFVGGAVLMLLLSNPLRRSEKAIRTDLLHEMPLGCSIAMVATVNESV